MKYKLKISLIIILFIFSNILILNNYAIAEGRGDQSGSVSIDNPLGDKNTDINVLIGQVINAVLGIVGSLALVMFIYGGFTWMLAAGNNEKVQKGKDILIWATIGLVVIFSAYAIVFFVFQGLGIVESTSFSATKK